MSSKDEYGRELADLRKACKELEGRNRGLAGKLKVRGWVGKRGGEAGRGSRPPEGLGGSGG